MALMEAQTCGNCSFKLIYGHICAKKYICLNKLKVYFKKFKVKFTFLTIFLLQNVDMNTG